MNRSRTPGEPGNAVRVRVGGRAQKQPDRRWAGRLARAWGWYTIPPSQAGGGPRLSHFGDATVTEQEIESKVIKIVADQLGADQAKITRATSFVDDLNADSLDQVELVMEFEDEFETSIPDEQAEKIKTVGQAIDFIKQAHGIE